MKKSLSVALVAACMASAASAQFYVPSGQPIPNVTSVTNEGVAVGYNDQNQPFFIWDAINDTQKRIGGISAGAGVGGVPRFDGSGKLIAAPMESDKINVFTAWANFSNTDMAPYLFCQTCYVTDYDLFAVGYTPDGKEGVIMKSSNCGQKWQRADMLSRLNDENRWENYTPDFPIYCIASTAASQNIILVGGGNGTLLAGGRNGASWKKTEIPGLNLPSPVKAYRDMNFTYITTERGYKDADKGCMLLELEDGSYTIIYTLDGTETFAVAEGAAAKPQVLGNNGKDFFVGTADGIIQVSKDGGKTWSNAFTEADGRPFHRIVFADENKGVALSDNVIYITRDGGTTWTQKDVLQSPAIGFPKTSSWNDAVWIDDYVMIIGTNGYCYKSTDDGETFAEVEGFTGDLGTIFRDVRKITSIIGQDGNTWRQEDKEYISGYTAGLYDVEADTWTPLTSTGYVSDSASSPWQISGDGKHVVGIVHEPNAKGVTVSHAAIWTGTDKVISLPNRFADDGPFNVDGSGRACRAGAVSYDGSVVAGWQDVYGPWLGSVWRKGEDGNYTQTILTAKDKGQDDIDWSDKNDIIANCVGACQTISPDGKWIGGRGIPGLALDGPWIWSEETGYKVLYEDMDGTVADINSDGTVAVGWMGPGSDAWIWSEKEGFSFLQEYVEKKLGHELEDFSIVSVYDMSPNGRYICGYGMWEDDPAAYVFDLFAKVEGVEEMEAAQIKASVYPNPVVSELHIDLPFDNTEVQTSLTLYDIQGRAVRRMNDCRQSNVMDVNGLTAGLYVLDVRTGNTHKTFKVLVK